MSRADPDLAARLVAMVRPSVAREYPNKPSSVLAGDADLRPPRERTPIFSGCFDWHSAVHSHWTLVRLLRLFPNAPWSAELRAELGGRFAAERVAVEVDHLRRQPGFELPYGTAWLLALGRELALGEEAMAAWSASLSPLVDEAAARFAAWLRALPAPIRTGEHGQSAFAMALALDAARTLGNSELARLVDARARAFYAGDIDAPVGYEPSAHDFLSPTLAEADLLRRVLPTADFARWLDGFLPSAERFEPVLAADPADGKLVHWNGLNASRAWMLEGVAAALPPGHPLAGDLQERARVHLDAALDTAFSAEYAGAHWLGTFALLALTWRM